MPRMKGKDGRQWRDGRGKEKEGEGRYILLCDEREWKERRKDGVENREERGTTEGMKWRAMEGKGR